ncbi:MAG: right-handed parallel beta-helix repeat-containing protein, partial [Candidatus Hodarchaeales archaeon]
MDKKQLNLIFNSLMFASILLMPIIGFMYYDNLRNLEIDSQSVQKIEVPALRDLNASKQDNHRFSYGNSNDNITYTTEGKSNEINGQLANNTKFRLAKFVITNPTDDPETAQTANGSEVGINRLNEDLDTSENDIIIDETTIWQNNNTFINYTIIVNSSILRLINTTLTFNCTTYFWGIEVIGNGELHLINSTIGSINGPSLIIANSTSLVNSTQSEIELFRGENNSTVYGTRTSTTAILLKGNSTIELNESQVGYFKGSNNTSMVIQEATSLNSIKLLDFATLSSNDSSLTDISLFGNSSLNSANDGIAQLSRTATILANETVTHSNFTSYITQSISISGSTIGSTKTNIYLGNNQKIWLINLSASVQSIDWVYGDNVAILKVTNSTLPLEGIIKSQLNATESDLSIVRSSIIGLFDLYKSDCLINNITILFSGNITVHSGGNLTLSQAEIDLNSSYNGEIHVDILDGGEMNINSNSTMTAFNNSFNYAIRANQRSTFRMENSQLENCGYSMNPSLAGLWINSTDELIFENNTITSNFHGLILENVFGLTLRNNTIINGITGIILNNSDFITIESNMIKNLGGFIGNSINGIVLESSNNCTFSDNIFTNITGGTGKIGAVQQQGDSGGSGLGIYLYNSFNNSIQNNKFVNITGGTGGIGGNQGDGGSGGPGIAIHVDKSNNNTFFNNLMNNITGGAGGNGGHKGNGGPGGLGAGIYATNSNHSMISKNKVNIVRGGTGGINTLPDINGTGGNAVGLYFENSSENIMSAVLINISGGIGSTDGSSEYVLFEGNGENNSWAYEIKEELHYDQNQTIFFGLDNSPLNDTQLIYYQVNYQEWISVDVTSSQNLTFTEEMISYGNWEWYYWSNDTDGNSKNTSSLSFSVTDNLPPTYSNLQQTSSSPEYNENNTVSVSVFKPSNASGVDTILLYYRVNLGSWTILDVNSPSNYTFLAAGLSYPQTYDWYFWFNDTAGNINSTLEETFFVNDTTAPTYSDVAQTSVYPEYDESNTVSITVSEPGDASGVDTILLYYKIDNNPLISVNVTGTSSYTFASDVLKFNQNYTWYFWFNDTAGNTGYSEELFFIVVDTYAPDVVKPASQNTITPEFNDTVIVSINVTEPLNASGLHKVWINYTTNNWVIFSVEEITPTQNFTFTSLVYGQTYNWTIGYNDTVGNTAYCPEFFFTVVDTYAPDIIEPASQTPSPPYQYNDTVVTSINVTEPLNASGLHKVWINYTTDNWASFTVKEITPTQNNTFTQLVYGQTYNWTIGYNDTVGNTAYCPEFFFTVVDTYAPDMVEPASQTPSPPYEYNDTVVASINVTEPINASGLHKVWINYTIDNWATYTIKDITGTQNYTFTYLVYGLTYNWTIGYNDTFSNKKHSRDFSFTVVDNYAPDVVIAATQNTTNPEFNETIMVSINVTEPINASGLHKVWINFTIDNWTTFSIEDITPIQNFTFTSLVYGQTYNWTMGYNDTADNTAYCPEFFFIVMDTYVPDVVEAASQTPSPPYEYNDTVVASINVTEPINASGLHKVWINYTTNNWVSSIVKEITPTQNYSFTQLINGQIYNWTIGYNDTLGNTGNSAEFSFTVVDNYAPDVVIAAIQNTTTPEFNETVLVSINVTEPINASGLHKVWINYTLDNWDSFTVKEITPTQNYSFANLVYGQIYNWTIGYNDTVGNTGYSNQFSFTVADNYPPDIVIAATQNTTTPEFNETVLVSINVMEPINASGLHKVWINFTIDNWATFSVEEITPTQNYTFTQLVYNQTYNWTIGYNDSVGNTDYSTEFFFTVVDTFAPDVVIAANQNTTTPEFNETILVSINVTEPINASGLHMVWINFTIDNWATFSVEEITPSRNYTFTSLVYGQIYNWTISYNDTAENMGHSAELSFTVVDSYAPDVIEAANQTPSPPYQYNDTVIMSINVTEPIEASGLHKVWINYTTDDWATYTINDITPKQNYTFTQLVYGQTYNWTMGYNDTAGNTDYSLEFSFIVVDKYTPDVIKLASQTPSPPYEYNDTVVASINVTESIEASGLHKVWINYTTNNWVAYAIKDITLTQNYTFTSLVYSQTYNWTIGYNDTAGNTGYSTEFFFTVVDSYKPDVLDTANQNTTTPEFNETVIVSINVTEPINASGLHMVWINYTIDNWVTFTIKDITLTQNHTFTSLVYGQTYNWTMGYNDTAGNTAYSAEFSLIIIDSYAPDIIEAASQTPSSPYQYNDTVVASINVTEPINASGLHKVWINYTTDNWASYTIKDITPTQNHTFTSLVYGQTYNWTIGYNDTASNRGYSLEFSFTVVDTFIPDVIEAASQTPS